MAQKLVRITPVEEFTGYPFGKKVLFRAGVESEPVPADYAQLLADKGHLGKASDKTEGGDA